MIGMRSPWIATVVRLKLNRFLIRPPHPVSMVVAKSSAVVQTRARLISSSFLVSEKEPERVRGPESPPQVLALPRLPERVRAACCPDLPSGRRQSPKRVAAGRPVLGSPETDSGNRFPLAGGNRS